MCVYVCVVVVVVVVVVAKGGEGVVVVSNEVWFLLVDTNGGVGVLMELYAFFSNPVLSHKVSLPVKGCRRKLKNNNFKSMNFLFVCLLFCFVMLFVVVLFLLLFVCLFV